MLDAARPKVTRAHLSNVDLLLADAAELPFPDASFDCITSGFLLRNVVDLPGCLSEMRRVLRPGGRVAALELTQLSSGPLSSVIRAYSRVVIPRVGALVSGDAAAYQYLPASVDTFPDAEHLAGLFREAGFPHVVYRRFGLGRVAIHLAAAGS
jgi:demethylmenaquinone methyltransferase/2-methoxy-6-polyprenyl-1,4-benzoquinol methylase